MAREKLSRRGLQRPGPSWAPSVPGKLVGTDEALLQQLADSMLKTDCASELRV